MTTSQLSPPGLSCYHGSTQCGQHQSCSGNEAYTHSHWFILLCPGPFALLTTMVAGHSSRPRNPLDISAAGLDTRIRSKFHLSASLKGEQFLGGSLRERHCLGPTGHTTGARFTLHAPSFGPSPIGLAGKLPKRLASTGSKAL